MENNYLNASLRHDGTAGDVILSFVNHHESAYNEIAFHISRFFRWPSEVERRFRV